MGSEAGRRILSDLAGATGTAVVLCELGIVSTITGVVIVQSLHAELVGGEQILEQLLHRHLATVKTGRIIVGVG